MLAKNASELHSFILFTKDGEGKNIERPFPEIAELVKTYLEQTESFATPEQIPEQIPAYIPSVEFVVVESGVYAVTMDKSKVIVCTGEVTINLPPKEDFIITAGKSRELTVVHSYNSPSTIDVNANGSDTIFGDPKVSLAYKESVRIMATPTELITI